MDKSQIMRRVHQTGPLQIVFVGTVIPRKSLDVLISGLSHLPREAWRLEVIGSLTTDPAYVHHIQRQVARKNLSESITFSGLLSDEGLACRLSRSHLLAVPSSYEGFGIVYLEAMGFGLPVLGSSIGAAPEIIRHSQDGFLVGPGDPIGVARMVELLHHNRKILGQMSLAALQRYHEHPTWAESAERIREFLLHVAK
jgi:glycosyltransferase involved in cell wall biosynthesis